MSAFRKKFEAEMPERRSRLRRFLTKTEGNPPDDLDATVLDIESRIWKKVDCLACSNCCRTMTPTYTFQDQRRIAAHLGMTIKAFREKWLFRNKKMEWMNRKTPCQFLDLKTNLCSIYAVRPADCSEFPHLTKTPVVEYIHVHKQNVKHCPATLAMVERLMERLI